MSPFFGDSGTQYSYKRLSGAPRRPWAASDSSSIEVVNSFKHPRPPTPPPRTSSWTFSQRIPKQRHTTPSESPKHRLRRTSKWPSLRSQVDSSPTQDPHTLIVKLKKIMSSPGGPTATTGGTSLTGPDRDRDRQATTTAKHSLPMPGLSGNANGPIGNLLKGPVDDSGRLKDAALLVGIKLDLEAEVHATARVRGDIVVGLY
ncbi:uncharacterized protein F4807DRAFT_454908 [Annulohypoxylon truncatum]|uniref:uncharacterized protein n=1 Tax=Annulohypoxylon truncatum TaxID=327061 RepID=UPI002008E1EE|nr:uncharacterized protein F4807DRAFT_454908 [Annulohypoxylon truncatum]KAI1204117.1 hypothetical protein F4807DRAFT_454908 [Annulohypoxylon truncatum]